MNRRASSRHLAPDVGCNAGSVLTNYPLAHTNRLNAFFVVDRSCDSAKGQARTNTRKYLASCSDCQALLVDPAFVLLRSIKLGPTFNIKAHLRGLDGSNPLCSSRQSADCTSLGLSAEDCRTRHSEPSEQVKTVWHSGPLGLPNLVASASS
jgi:hypothetical protein